MTETVANLNDIPAALPFSETDDTREKLLREAAGENTPTDENLLVEDEDSEILEPPAKTSKKKLFLAFVGFIFGFILALLGVEQQIIQFVTGSLGFVIGFLLSVLPMRMILGKNFGDFRLVLISNTDASQIAATGPQDKSGND